MVQQSHLIENIYRTAHDPKGWEPLLGALVRETGSRSARMLVMNAAADRVEASLKVNIDDHYHRQYADFYVNKCPWRPELKYKPAGRLYSTYLHFSCRQPDFYRTEFFNDWAARQDIHHGLCGTVHRDGQRTVQLLIQRTRDQGHYTQADTDFVNNLVPHMQHALLIADKFVRASSRANAVTLAASGEALPFLLFDHHLRLVFSSQGAERILAGDAVLRLKNGRLLLAEPYLNRRLGRLLGECLKAAATRTLDCGGGLVSVPRPERPDLQLLVKPLHPDLGLLREESNAYVAVYLHEPDACWRVDRQRLRQLYRLSSAESRVAEALLQAPDSAAVARRCGISLNTLRTHVKAILAKTGARNRAELLKFLLTGPACLPGPADPRLPQPDWEGSEP